MKPVYDRVASFFKWVVAIMVFIMMTLTFVDVVGRYIFTAPVFGAAEMIQFLMGITVFSGLVVVNAKDKHISVELFEHRLKMIFGVKLYYYLIQGFSLLCMLIITGVVAQYAYHAWKVSSLTVVLEWPLYLVCGAMALMAMVSSWIMLAHLFKPRNHKTEFYIEDPK